MMCWPPPARPSNVTSRSFSPLASFHLVSLELPPIYLLSFILLVVALRPVPAGAYVIAAAFALDGGLSSSSIGHLRCTLVHPSAHLELPTPTAARGLPIRL